MLHRVVTLTVLTEQEDGTTPVWNLPSCLVAINKGYACSKRVWTDHKQSRQRVKRCIAAQAFMLKSISAWEILHSHAGGLRIQQGIYLSTLSHCGASTAWLLSVQHQRRWALRTCPRGYSNHIAHWCNPPLYVPENCTDRTCTVLFPS